MLYPVPNIANNASLSFHKWQCKFLSYVDITVVEIMYSPVRGTVNTPVFGSYALPLLSHTLSNTITSLPDVRNDFTDVNDVVNAGLSGCLPGSEIFMIRDVDNIIYSLGAPYVCGVRVAQSFLSSDLWINVFCLFSFGHYFCLS